MAEVREQFGPIDIYLFDQILRGRIQPGMRILDAGCGGGRNLVFFLREDYDVFGIDQDAAAIEEVRRLACAIAPQLSHSHFQVAAIEQNPHPDGFFDFVIASAVLHFAASDRHFQSMLNGIWRVLKPGGIFFARLASSTGIEAEIRRVSGRHYRLPDGSERYLVDAALLEKQARKWKAASIDPLKTTLVHGQRSMTTWVIQKPA